MSVAITATDIDPASRRPHTSSLLAIPIEYLNGWLFGISANRVNPEIRDRLITYQRDCYRVLYEAMQDGRLTINHDKTGDISSDTLTDAQQAVVLAQAVLRIAQAQLRLEQEQAAQAAKLTGLEGRIESLETAVAAPSRVISSDQAMQLWIVNPKRTTVEANTSNAFGMGVFWPQQHLFTHGTTSTLPWHLCRKCPRDCLPTASVSPAAHRHVPLPIHTLATPD